MNKIEISNSAFYTLEAKEIGDIILYRGCVQDNKMEFLCYGDELKSPRYKIILRAFKEVIEKNNNILLYMCSSPILDKELIPYESELGIEKNCIHISKEELTLIMEKVSYKIMVSNVMKTGYYIEQTSQIIPCNFAAVLDYINEIIEKVRI